MALYFTWIAERINLGSWAAEALGCFLSNKYYYEFVSVIKLTTLSISK